ncbi:MAG: beta-N-acetylhexosaminidase [Porticoccaceae bacterium]|nr:beta-N-acetylhexosaminidase [Porticoccaceae bacterium]
MGHQKYGRLMLDLAGTELLPAERELLKNQYVGGVILFARNIDNRLQICRLVEDIRSCSEHILIAVDQEGGRVQRFKQGFTDLPPMQLLGDLVQSNSDRGLELARDCGWLMASEVLACGLDISFAPVLDVDRNHSSIIGDRAFSDNAEQVILAADAFISGMNEAGMAATGKHFPGHGGVVADSHLEAPIDHRTMAELEARDLKPFISLANDLAAVMPAHITFPNIDSSSVGFSEYWLQQILRSNIGFEGVIFSDDLTMKGADVAGGYIEKSDMALAAGCDMILVCNCPEGARDVLAHLEQLEVKGCEKIATMRAQKEIHWEQLTKLSRYHQTIKQLKHLTDTGN